MPNTYHQDDNRNSGDRVDHLVDEELPEERRQQGGGEGDNEEEIDVDEFNQSHSSSNNPTDGGLPTHSGGGNGTNQPRNCSADLRYSDRQMSILKRMIFDPNAQEEEEEEEVAASELAAETEANATPLRASNECPSVARNEEEEVSMEELAASATGKQGNGFDHSDSSMGRLKRLIYDPEAATQVEVSAGAGKETNADDHHGGGHGYDKAAKTMETLLEPELAEENTTASSAAEAASSESAERSAFRTKEEEEELTAKGTEDPGPRDVKASQPGASAVTPGMPHAGAGQVAKHADVAGQGGEEAQEALGTAPVAANRNSDALPGAYAFSLSPTRLDEPLSEDLRTSTNATTSNGGLPASAPMDVEGLAVASPVTDPSGNLPVAQEYDHADDYMAAKQRKKSTHRKLRVYIGSGVLIVIAAIVMAVVLSQRSSGTDDVVGSTNTTNSSATEAPTHTESPEEVYVKKLLPDYTLKVLDHNGVSPQSQAFQWVMADPWLDWRIQQGEDWRMQQRFALATLYYATGGEDIWLNTTGWLSYDVHECLWYAQPDFGLGVYYPGDNITDNVYMPEFSNPCEEEDPSNIVSQGFFQNLWLWGNILKGSLPPELYMLTALKSVSLDSPDLTGTISTRIGELQAMQHVALMATALSGTLPTEIGLLQKMTSLSLFANLHTGSLPSELGQLLECSSLIVDTNYFTGGIPTELGLLTKMSLLYLHGNELVGSVPTEIGFLTNMENLYFYVNQLSSSIPTELGLLTNLKRFYGDTNSLSGRIPTEIGFLTEMFDLQVYTNQLTGSLPSELGLLTKLAAKFDLSDNALVGSIPTEIGELGLAGHLYLHSNFLDSTLPSEIGRLTSLFGLFLSDNKLSGTIPTEFGLLNLELPPHETSFVGLWLDGNLLDGSIPSEIGLVSSLPALWLQGNQLSGSIPQEVFDLAEGGSLTDLNVTGNLMLSGIIPESICSVDMLFDFDCTPSLCGCACPCG